MWFYIHRASLDELAISLGNLIENWLQLETDYPYLTEAIEILTTEQQHHDDVVLLLLFRALEFFHDNEIGSQALPQDQHKLRVKQIVSQIADSADREWVHGVLTGKNRKGQSLVLTEILERCGQVGRMLLQHYPNFVRDAIKTRNQLVHTRVQDKQTFEYFRTVYVGLVWIVRRLVTEKALGSCQTADDYISNDWRFTSYLEEAEDGVSAS